MELWEYIKKYGSYFLSRDWGGLKWRPVLKVWEQLQDEHSKTLIDETLSYSYIKYNHRVPLLLLTIEKIKCENSDFVLFFLLLLFHHA